MEELIIGLLLIVLLVVLIASLIALPVVVFVQGRRLRSLRHRLDALERRQAATLEAGPRAPGAPVPPTVEPAAAEEPPVELSPAALLLPAAQASPAATFEAWIGGRALGWVAVVLLLLATAFFLKHTFENRWVGELGRVASGVLAGVVLCLAGLRYHRKGWPLPSQMLTAGGVILLYLTTFGAFGYYHLLPQQHAAVFLIVLIAETALVAILYDRPAIALMAVIGALLTPLLLHTEHDQYRALFSYLAVVNAGVVGVALARPWPIVGTVALLGTQGLFWGWYAESYHPEKLAAAILFQVAVLLLFLAYNLVVYVLRRRNASAEDLVRLLLVGVLFLAAAYTLLDEDYHVWMGTLALAVAVVYAAIGAAAAYRRPEDTRQLLATVAIAMGFVAMVFPLQADAVWISLGWAVQGLALWWFGLRVSSGALRGVGGVLLGLAAGKLVLVDTPSAHFEPFVPLANDYALPAAGVAVCVLAAAAAARRFPSRLRLPDRMAAWGAGLGGVLLAWLILSVETYQHFDVQVDQKIAAAHEYGGDAVDEQGEPLRHLLDTEITGLRRQAQTALSVVWAVYAAVILALGFRLRSSPVRWTALVLLGVTLGKVLLVDMAGLPGFYRVATFLVLAIVLGVAAWAYQQLQPKQRAEQEEVVSDDPL